MLIGIDPLLDPDLLWTLRAMGHGDTLALVDANFPAAALARRLHRLDGCDAGRALGAILSVMPVDDFIAPACFCMAHAEDGLLAPIADDFAAILRRAGVPPSIAAVPRQAFYDRARDCFALVATGERRLYGNIILTKGVMRDDGA